MTTWDAEKAAELQRTAYRSVGRALPRLALAGRLEAIGRADREVLEAEIARDWSRYEEALRELCRVARREAERRAA